MQGALQPMLAMYSGGDRPNAFQVRATETRDITISSVKSEKKLTMSPRWSCQKLLCSPILAMVLHLIF